MIRSLICGTFVLLLVLVIASQAWSAKPQPPGHHLNITEVIVDDQSNPTSITIMGVDFLFGSPLVVTLGEFGPLAIIGVSTDTTIVATLPAGILPGDYLLTVSTGNGQSQGDEYDLTIGTGLVLGTHVHSITDTTTEPIGLSLSIDCNNMTDGHTNEIATGGGAQVTGPDDGIVGIRECVSILQNFPSNGNLTTAPTEWTGTATEHCNPDTSWRLNVDVICAPGP